MNKTAKKVWIWALAGIMAASALLAGVFLLFPTVRSAIADSSPTQVEFKIDGSSDADLTLVQGQTITLTATVSTTRTAEYWNAINMYFSVIKKDATTYDTSTVDTDLSPKMSLVARSASSNFSETLEDEYGDPYLNYTLSYADQFKADKSYKGLRLVVAFNQGDYRVGAESCVITVKLKLDDDIAEGSQFQFAMRAQADSNVMFRDHTDTKKEISDIASQGNFTANVFNVTVREASEDNTLKDLEVGHDSSALTSLAVASEVDGEPAVVPDAPEYTFNFDDLTSFYVKPTANDANAKVGVAINQQVTFTDVTSGSSEQLMIVDPSTLTDGDHNMLYVKVTAENGTAKTYSVTVKMGYVRLNSITASASTPTSGVTKNGLDLSATADTYDKDTFAYNVFVPSDYDTDGGAVTVNASVLTGYDASTTIALVGTGCDPMQLDGATAASQLTSAGTVLVKNIVFPASDGDAAPTLTLTATASDGVTTQVYTLTFIEVSVNADLDTIVVTGVETSKTFDSDSAQATSNSVDYYYLLIGETQKKASVAIAAKSAAATVGVGWTDDTVTETLPEYSNPTVYEEGEYTITIEAEAGNTKTYKFILAAALYLRLAEDTDYAFIAEKELENVDEPGSYVPYRVSYEQFGWEHGVDDLDKEQFEMVVLGQIHYDTCVKDFVKNLDATQLSMIKIYAHDDSSDTGYSVIYNCGAPGDGYTEDDLEDTIDYAVATGWYITYGADEETADKVYISVLGDVSRDGLLDGGDVGNISSFLMDRADLDVLYVRLAARVFNDGYISGNDTSTLNSIIMDRTNIDRYLTKYPEVSEESEEEI